jgi:hypothetical protein
MELPWRTTTFTFGLDQSFIVNEENSDDEKLHNAPDYFETWYMVSDFYVQWKIPTGLEAWNYGSIDYVPSINQTFRYHPGIEMSRWRQPTLSFGHSIGFSQIDWKGNFRKGLAASLSNGYSLNEGNLTFGSTIAFDTRFHHRFNEYFGVSTRLQYKYWFGDPSTGAGDVLRGLHNDRLYARQQFSVNLDLPFRILRFVPSEWFRRRWMKLFDFEMHASPFVDLSISEKPGESVYSSSPEGVITTAGLELIVFPLRWRSLFLRVSAGWNMREWLTIHNPPSDHNRELFIGVGHFY